MTWRDRPMAGFDLETTGVDVETARIVTACVGLATPGQGWSPRNWLFTQDTEILAEATAIHKITTEFANEYGTDPASNLAAIREDLAKAWSLGMPVVGHNVVYDLTVLDRELRRYDLAPLEIGGPVLDTLVLDKALIVRRGSRRLTDVATFHGVPLSEEDAHGAEADARAACRVAWKLGGRPWKGTTGRGPILAVCATGLHELHVWQAEQFRAQRESFAAYLASKGESIDDPSTDWPLRPLNPVTAAQGDAA